MQATAHACRRQGRSELVARPAAHWSQSRYEIGERQTQKERDQVSGGPRVEERKAGRAGSRKKNAFRAMPRRVGWTSWTDVGGGVTCTDCHSQRGQCAGAGSVRATVKEVWREWEAECEAPADSDGACECVSVPNVLKNTYSSDTKAASLRFAGEFNDKKRLPVVSTLPYVRFDRL